MERKERGKKSYVGIEKKDEKIEKHYLKRR